MPVPHRSSRFVIAAVVLLASCSEPVRPATPAPEVPVRPVPPANPPPSAPPAVSATRLPAPALPAEAVPAPAVAAPTPQDQGAGEVDTAITAVLRAAIRERRELSAEAHALMVTTRERVVTLRGTVADETERDAVLSLAHALPEVQRVDDQLEPIVR